jgi:hypothetical protein
VAVEQRAATRPDIDRLHEQLTEEIERLRALLCQHAIDRHDSPV